MTLVRRSAAPNLARISHAVRKLLALCTVTVLIAGLSAIAAPAMQVGAQDEQNDQEASVGQVSLTESFTPEKAYFEETGHNVDGEFLQHWLDNGDFTIYGLPISEPIFERGRLVQYFERARLEYWPENEGSKWVIQGTLLGSWKAQRVKDRKPFLPLMLENYNPEDGFYYFKETGHTLANGFKKFWEENGGVHVFGFPISEEFNEDGRTVQYFERARFEWHPENAGTPYEILLGHLGKEYAEAHGVKRDQASRDADAIEYDAGVFTRRWGEALPSGDSGRWAFVDVDALNIRAEPSEEADILDVVYSRRPLRLTRMVVGQEVKGVSGWYELETGGYVPAVYVDPLVVPAPPQTFGGAWVDVNLSEFYAIAYHWDTPVYVAIITAGRGDRTPTGTFEILARVENETMDSATVGFPPGHPEYYYLENVKYTQYFLDGGYALHGNYWTPEASFGRFSSNGCIGLLEEDAYFFWNHLNFGSVVNIHF